MALIVILIVVSIVILFHISETKLKLPFRICVPAMDLYIYMQTL